MVRLKIYEPHKGINAMDLGKFIIDFQDHLAPKLDTYEQAIYLYIFRHSRLIGKEDVVIGFKSARARVACGVGQKGKPMSENTAYEKLQSLESKGCIKILTSERTGRRIYLKLPQEISGVIAQVVVAPPVSLEEIDFFNSSENRFLILNREDHRCFYCLRALTSENHVIEHVISRPNGNNSYRNVVAACRQCNNRKGNSSADDFLRTLYRESFLSATEFEERLSHLERLRNGELKPALRTNNSLERSIE